MNLWTKSQKVLAAMAISLGLVACGGGGGSAGTVSGGTTTPVATDAVNTLAVSVKTTVGDTTHNISQGGGQTLSAVLKDTTGAVVANKLVTFSVQPSSLAVLSPATALTNSKGEATVSIAPASATVQGAGTVEAQAKVGDVSITGSVDFTVQAANLSLTSLVLGSNQLLSGGNTSLETTVLINGQPASGVPTSVAFTASCGRINELDAVAGVSVTTDGSGKASATYRAVGMDGTLCKGSVNLTVNSTGASTQTGSLAVSDPPANAMTFVNANPSRIFVSGAGAAEQSVVTFRVLSGSTPLANVPVKFTIEVNPGGVGLGATGSTVPVTVTTDSTGVATVSVFSGTIPGPVKVRASLVSNSAVFSDTQNLTVASGPPSQRYMSLSAETFNIEGWNVDGSSTLLNVFIADRQGNPVENGTVINFTAEGGQVEPSCATGIVNGVSRCSVNFVSQNPRPTGGRASVLAYVAGTKDYVDVDRNNKYDGTDTLITDTLINQGDAYRDDNENGIFDTGEFVIPRGGAVTCASSGAPFPSRANTCDKNSVLATTVRQQIALLFSSSTPARNVTSISTSGINFTLASANNPLLPMPAGTVVSIDASDATNNGIECSVVKVFGTPVPNVSPGSDPLASLITSHSGSFKDCAGGDSVTISVKAPSGLTTSFTHQIPSTTPSSVADSLEAQGYAPTQIYVKGNSLAETATVSFKLLGNSSPVPNQSVKLTLVNNEGGISFSNSSAVTSTTATSNSSGVISVPVYSGTLPTSVKVRAELVSDPTIFAEALGLTIASGPPSQRYFSVFSVENRSSLTSSSTITDRTTLVVRAADRHGNAVPAGTIVNFTSSLGQVGSSCALAVTSGISSCTVEFYAQPVTANTNVSVLAYVTGTKDYTDNNGNNQFDSGTDTLDNQGDAYRDDDRNGVYTAGEFIISRGVSGGTCLDSGVPTPGRSGTCDNQLATTVRRQLNFTFTP